jgi:hypothetical protein
LALFSVTGITYQQLTNSFLWDPISPSPPEAHEGKFSLRFFPLENWNSRRIVSQRKLAAEKSTGDGTAAGSVC